MKYEYATTLGQGALSLQAPRHVVPSAPIMPEGDGWEFCGATADQGYLYFFWKRPVKP
jgi:hypothetical protein